jgi:Bacterial regulatory protein, Fis family
MRAIDPMSAVKRAEELFHSGWNCAESVFVAIHEQAGEGQAPVQLLTALADYFLRRAAVELGKAPPVLAKDAVRVLQSYWAAGWDAREPVAPSGSVRELENAMERMAILCEERVAASDLGKLHAEERRPLSWGDIERQAIDEALRMNSGNRTLAAQQLGISLRTLQYRLKEYPLEDDGAGAPLRKRRTITASAGSANLSATDLLPSVTEMHFAASYQ